MQNRQVKVLLTGGHAHATAYAVIKSLKKLEPDVAIIWVGPKSLVEGEQVAGVEEAVFGKFGVDVFSVNAGKVPVKFTPRSILSILKIPVGFFESLFVLLKIHPDVTVSFGGFVGLPVVIWSYFLGIPVIIHEQTAAAGRGNIYASRFARKIAISRPESGIYFPSNKTLLVGNPIDAAVLKSRPRRSGKAVPVIFVTGGHSGSKVLNNCILSVLPNLLESFKVVHQVGKLDYIKFGKVQKSLPSGFKSRYTVYSNIDPRDWPGIINGADIVISRSGANIVSQLVALQKPCILVPIPHTYLDEQGKNADFAVQFGIAVKINQSELNAENIIKNIFSLKGNISEITARSKERKSPDLDASMNFAKLILDESSKKEQTK